MKYMYLIALCSISFTAGAMQHVDGALEKKRPIKEASESFQEEINDCRRLVEYLQCQNRKLRCETFALSNQIKEYSVKPTEDQIFVFGQEKPIINKNVFIPKQ